MKTLTQIYEDFKISKNTKRGQQLKVLLIESENIMACPFTIAGSGFGIVYLLDDEYKYHYVGATKTPWTSKKDVEKSFNFNITNLKHAMNYVLVDKDSIHGIKSAYNIEISYGVVDKELFMKTLQNDNDLMDIHITYPTDEAEKVLNSMINKGYLSRV